MAPDTMTVHFRSTRSSETEPTTGYTTTTDVTGTHGSVTLYYSSSNSGSVPERVTERVWIEEGYENELYRQQKLAARYRIELWLAERRRASLIAISTRPSTACRSTVASMRIVETALKGSGGAA
jgi:hypothetical protein